MRRVIANAVLVLVTCTAVTQITTAQTPSESAISDAVHTEVVTIRSLSYAYQMQAAQAALAACEIKSQRVAVVIVDSAGNTRMIMVGDRANPALVESARRKAYTAVQMRQTTATLQKALAAKPHMLIPPNSNFLIAAGGVPFFAGTQVVGAVGLEGGDPQAMDECAHAAVDKLSGYLRPAPPRNN